MNITQINYIAYYIILYAPLAAFILYQLGFLKNFVNKQIYIKDIKYEGGNTFIYFLKVWLFITIVEYFVLGFFISILVFFGAFPELKTDINESYFLLYSFRKAIEISLFTVFIFSFRFDKPLHFILYSYIVLNIYYQIFGNFLTYSHLQDYVLPRITE